MSIVIHTIHNQRYAYDHVWNSRTKSVDSRYVGPVGSGTQVREALHGGGRPRADDSPARVTQAPAPKQDKPRKEKTIITTRTPQQQRLDKLAIDQLEIADKLHKKALAMHEVKTSKAGKGAKALTLAQKESIDGLDKYLSFKERKEHASAWGKYKRAKAESAKIETAKTSPAAGKDEVKAVTQGKDTHSKAEIERMEKEYNLWQSELKVKRAQFDKERGDMKEEIRIKKEKYSGMSDSKIKAIKKAERLGNLSKAGEVKRNKFLDERISYDGKISTRRTRLEKNKEEGWHSEVIKIRQHKKEEALQQDISYMRLNAPTGNENHPETIKLRKMQEQLKNHIYKDQYRITNKEETWGHDATKVEYDYFNSL